MTRRDTRTLKKSIRSPKDTKHTRENPSSQAVADVSKFIVDLRDDGDDAVTIRSLVLGTLIAGLGAALVQIYYFKPVVVSVSTVFLLLVAWTIGEAMANLLPRRSTVQGTRFEFLGPVVHAINPGPFGLKEFKG
ncbi:hypothetical protein MPER_00835, partial [Moniliophthora perniciosa FA553]